MGILYVLRTSVPFGDLPPAILSSSWGINIQNNLVKQSDKYYFRIFLSIDMLQPWLDSRRLTDSEVISVLNEWKAIDGNSITESYYELPSYNHGGAGLIS
jgi:hypothetical protein